MKLEEVKKDYINIIKKFKVEEDFLNQLVEFIETYDGTNYAEFHILLVHLMNLLAKHKKMKIKAEAYDKIVETKIKYMNRLEQIKDEYEIFQETGGHSIPYSTDKNKEAPSQSGVFE
jgi:hypothetical protein